MCLFSSKGHVYSHKEFLGSKIQILHKEFVIAIAFHPSMTGLSQLCDALSHTTCWFLWSLYLHTPLPVRSWLKE